MPSVPVPPSLRFFSTRRILQQIIAKSISGRRARLISLGTGRHACDIGCCFYSDINSKY
jgi:hypothetical protein